MIMLCLNRFVLAKNSLIQNSETNVTQYPQKRRIINFLIEPLYQFSFVGYSIISIILFTMAVGFYAYYVLGDFVNIMIMMSDIPQVTKEMLIREIQSFLLGLMIILFVFSLVISIFLIIKTHKIAGAKYAIVNYFKQNLLQNKLDKPLKLRRNDYLQEIANVTNEFVEKIKNTSHK